MIAGNSGFRFGNADGVTSDGKGFGYGGGINVDPLPEAPVFDGDGKAAVTMLINYYWTTQKGKIGSIDRKLKVTIGKDFDALLPDGLRLSVISNTKEIGMFLGCVNMPQLKCPSPTASFSSVTANPKPMPMHPFCAVTPDHQMAPPPQATCRRGKREKKSSPRCRGRQFARMFRPTDGRAQTFDELCSGWVNGVKLVGSYEDPRIREQDFGHLRAVECIA